LLKKTLTKQQEMLYLIYFYFVNKDVFFYQRYPLDKDQNSTPSEFFSDSGPDQDIHFLPKQNPGLNQESQITFFTLAKEILY